MKILRKLTLADLKLNKKRTIGTLVGIVLATALITVVGGMFYTFQNTIVEDTVRMTGYYHIAIKNVDNKEVEKLSKNNDFKHLEVIKNLGFTTIKKDNINYNNVFSMMDDSIDINNIDYSTIANMASESGIDVKNLDLDTIDLIIDNYFNYKLISMSEDTHDYLKYKIYKGTFPKNTDEILVDLGYIRENELEIGDKTTLVFTNGKIKEYKIVGITSNSGEFITSLDNECENNDVYLTLKNPNNYKRIFSKLLEIEDYSNLNSAKYSFQLNKELLRWESGAFSDNTKKVLYDILAVVIGIILVTSVFSIRNSFAISVNEKTKTYGMLSSIGATRKQIRRMVLLEGLYLGLIGIGIGIILGNMITYFLTIILNLLASNANLVIDDEKFLYYKFNIYPSIISIIVGTIMIYLSTLTSSIKASRTSPIQNIKNSNEIKNPKKLRVPFYIKNIFKIGGVLAYKNLKRSKKKYRVTVISLTVSIFVFIVVTSFLQYGIKTIKDQFINLNYDISIENLSNMELDVDTKKLLNLGNSHASYVLIDKENEYYPQLVINDNLHATKFASKSSICVKNDNDGTCIEDKDILNSNTAIYDDSSFKEYCKMIGANYNKVKDKAIIVDSYKEDKKYVRLTDYKSGDIVPYIIEGEPSKSFSYEVGKVTDIRPWGLEFDMGTRVNVIINQKYYKGNSNLVVDNIYYETKDAKKIENDAYDISKDIRVNNISEMANQLRTIVLIFSIFIYGFIIVVTFIGITSVFNTINSNMELRRREFASLKSIGMTKKEFNNMILLESVLYSFKSLMFGIVLGTIGSYFVYNSFKNNVDFGYIIPIKPIIISIVFIVILVYTIMKYSVSRLNKENIIETIRKENI